MPGDCGHGSAPTANRDDSDTDRPRRSRRRFLTASGGVAATVLAGCSNVLPGGDDDAPEITPNTDDENDDEDATPTRVTPPGIPSETHVTSLQYKTKGSTRTFYVTLSPADSGADWWQIETLGGEKITRRSFDEARTGDRFTTTKDLEVDDGTDAIVVRGHSVNGGYGGQVMLANLETGYIVAEQQEDEPASFEDYTFDTPGDRSGDS